MHQKIKLNVTLFFLLIGINSQAQLAVYNLMEYQWGNIPYTQPTDRNALYNQFNLAYKYKGFRASTRLESYFTDDTTGGEYVLPTQWNLNYNLKGLNLNAGHFYETLGRGLLLRGFEIKNSVFEDQIYRVKQGFFRDIRGASGSYNHPYFSVKALFGDVLNNELPPLEDDNRLDHVTATEIKANIYNQSIGGIYLENINPSNFSQYVGVLAEGYIGTYISYYGEFGQQINRGQKFGELSDDGSYGGYFALDFSAEGFGISLELKEYRNLFIGSGINDPPTLVKEQSYRTLNRSTHISDLNGERGFQGEGFYRIAENHLVTLNFARAQNRYGDLKFNFQEIFGEWYFDINPGSNIKLFGDIAYDDIFLEKSRLATGVYYTFPLVKDYSLSVETEYQHIERGFNDLTAIINTYGGLILNYKSKFTASFIWEYTTDEIVADNPTSDVIEAQKHYFGGSFNYKPNMRHSLTLFAGERRGGPACSSGICYEVLDFKGVELRWTARL